MSYACWLSIFYSILTVYIKRDVSSPMLFGCFFRWIDEISFVFEVEKIFTEKVWEVREWLRDIYILWRYTAVSWNERVIVFSLEVTLERVCWLSKWNVKKRKSVGRRSIYRKYVSWSRLQKREMKLKCGRIFKHWPRSSSGQWVLETECLLASAIFSPGTSGITSILNHRSVSPINYNTISRQYLWKLIFFFCNLLII